MVYIYSSHKQIASHKRITPGVKNGKRTEPSHLPYKLYTPDTVDSTTEKAKEIGVNTHTVVCRLYREAKVQEQALMDVRSVLDIANLYNDEILEEACRLALKDFHKITYNTLMPYVKILSKDKIFSNETTIEKSKSRIKILRKIADFEREGKFDTDVEEDPPSIRLMREDVDYLNKKSSNKIKNKIANSVGKFFLDDLLKDKKLIIKQINGLENLKELDSGAVLTCNHFNPFDSFAIEKAFMESGQNKKKKLYKVIREGNYTNFPGLYGFFFRHCDTLPLSSSTQTMIEFLKSVDEILQRKDFILIYPEQSMWWNYKKPKPLKIGAFRFASRNNVPIIPIFRTMQDSEIIGEDGFFVQEYIINIEKPIYPDEKLSERENAYKMKDENYEVWKKVYENFYGIPLEYNTNTNKDEN